MKITKIIEHCLNIPSPIDFYSHPDNPLVILKELFEGRCFKECLITKVLEIIEMSEMQIQSLGGIAPGSIRIKFKIEGIVYLTNEVINGCKVINKDKRTILAKKDNADIFILNTTLLESITEKNIIPVIVSKSLNKINSTSVALSGNLYLPNKKLFGINITGYYISDKNTQVDISRVESEIENMKYEEDQKDKLLKSNKKGYEFFRKVLYPYQEDKKPSAETISIHKLIKGQIPTGVWLVKEDIFDFDSDKISIYKDLPEDYDKGPNYEINSILNIMIHEYSDNLRIIREMMDIYSTEELIQANTNLFKLFKKTKK